MAHSRLTERQAQASTRSFLPLAAVYQARRHAIIGAAMLAWAGLYPFLTPQGPAQMGEEGHLSSGYFQGQWYFETICQGKWLELHFSKVFKDGEDQRATHAEVMKIVQSIQP